MSILFSLKFWTYIMLKKSVTKYRTSSKLFTQFVASKLNKKYANYIFHTRTNIIIMIFWSFSDVFTESSIHLSVSSHWLYLSPSSNSFFFFLNLDQCYFYLKDKIWPNISINFVPKISWNISVLEIRSLFKKYFYLNFFEIIAVLTPIQYCQLLKGCEK